MVSASRPGASMAVSEGSSSAGTFLLSLAYCSNVETVERISASSSFSVPGLSGSATGWNSAVRNSPVSWTRVTSARWPPSTSTFTVPSGRRSICSTLARVPTL